MRWIVLLLLGTMLAGCGEPPEVEAEALEAAPVGELRGVVVDATIQPLPGARVVAMPGDVEATTDAEGMFRFEGLEPGTYTLSASMPGFLETQTVATVLADRPSPVARLVLDPNPEAIAYVSAYQFEGYFECGVWPVACSNVNILTWIVLCDAGLCLGNVTGDRALFLQWISGPPSFLQTELIWDSTQPLGDSLGFAIGGATEEQLSTGQADTHNATWGPSPQMLTIQDPVLGESGIGADRALLTQVVAAPTQEVPGGCAFYDPCGPGAQLFQPFETFTHAFYGFEPEPGWRFSVDGAPENP